MNWIKMYSNKHLTHTHTLTLHYGCLRGSSGKQFKDYYTHIQTYTDKESERESINMMMMWNSRYLICNHLSLHLIKHFPQICSHWVKISTVSVKMGFMDTLLLSDYGKTIKFYFLLSFRYKQTNKNERTYKYTKQCENDTGTAGHVNEMFVSHFPVLWIYLVEQ